MIGNNKWLIVALGNPGTEFEDTRHNAGFIIIDEIAKKLNLNFKKFKYDSLVAEYNLNGQKFIFLKPQTFMNKSGYSVAGLLSYYKIIQEHLIVVHDDINFNIGKIKIKQNGSSGGHKGISSIIEYLNSTDFIRIKIGVGQKPSNSIDLKDWVVSHFTPNELENIIFSTDSVFDVLTNIVNENIQKAMNKYN